MEKEKLKKRPLTLAERIALAEEGLDKMGRDFRILPPPIWVDENGQPADPGKVSDGWEDRLRRYCKPSSGKSFDYAGFAEARCPAPYLTEPWRGQKIYKNK